MKITTDSCVFGAWAADRINHSELIINNFLDIGTGSGLLSLMVAQKNKLRIDSVEIDKEAAGQAKENIAASPWHEFIKVHHLNILSMNVPLKYDVIVCNPPFYENELASDQPQKNIAHHSEELTIGQVLKFISVNLAENGLFFLLIPYKRDEEIKLLMQQNALYPLEFVILKQSVKHAPFRIIIKGTNKKSEIFNTQTLSIWDEKQKYTEDFVKLMKDYYLYL